VSAYRSPYKKSCRATALILTAICSGAMLVAALPQPANGFVPFVDMAGKPYSWDMAAQPDGQIHWCVDPDAPTILRESMLFATQAWADATGGKLRFIEVPAPADPFTVFYGITVNWDAAGTRLVDASYLAYSTFSVSASTGRIVTSRIVVNAKQYTWHRGEPFGQTYGEGGVRRADLDGVMLHELGHSLGLDHSDKLPSAIVGTSTVGSYPTMNSIVFPGIESLHMDDIAGIQSLYGTGEGAPGYDAGIPPMTITAVRVKKKRGVTYDFSTQNGGDATTMWDFGDDEQAIGATVQHRYRWRGEFTVTALWNGRVATLKVQGMKGRVRLIDLLRGRKRQTLTSPNR